MTDKEKIRAEVERRIEELQSCNTRENLRAHGAIAGYYQILSFINSMQEEPVSEDLEEAASRYAKEEYNRKSPATLPDRCKGCYAPLMYAFKAGAKWKEEQLEKNRLAHCDAQTEEEAEVERDFVTGIIKKEHRLPTFDDAIKYGYHQAEKDLGLTWEDIEQIYFLVMVEANKLNKYKHDVKEMYQEVLKRFKEMKEK